MFTEKSTRGISQILLILFLGSLFLLAYQYKEGRITLASFGGFRNPYCNVPVKIVLGNVDPKFDLKKETILAELSVASHVWENEETNELFVFEGKSKSQVIVNFVYDARQEETIESERARMSLETGWRNYESLVAGRRTLANQYQDMEDSYEKAVQTYNERLASYENKVRRWNRNQGTEREYSELKAEKSRIDADFQNLEKRRIAINSLASRINESNVEIQDIYRGLVQRTNDYNRLFSSDEPITVGEYDGTYYINIYQFTDLAQLRITLAHELGHSLGMDHTENEKSIMYPLQSKQDGDSLILTEDDKRELRKVCE